MNISTQQKICKNCKYCKYIAKIPGMLKYYCKDENYGVNAFHSCMYWEKDGVRNEQ